MDTLTLSGRTAIVTGGSRGIGLSIARGFAQSGMHVAIIGKNQDALEKACLMLAELPGKCRSYSCDILRIDEITNTLESIVRDFGSIDVLVNCAGILDTSTIDQLTEEQWDDVLDTNLKGSFFMMQKAAPYLEKSRAPRIINIASNAGRMGGYENGLAYTASKGGLIALTYGAARRLANKGITVNCVAPGTIQTQMAEAGYDSETQKRLINRFPLGRFGKPEEVAAAVRYFASEEASFTTGAVLDVNGGMFMG